MSTEAGVEIARKAFGRSRKSFVELAGMFVDDPEAVVASASNRFDEMLPTMAYIDRPEAPMAESLFWCSASLALYLELVARGVDVHAYGRAMVEQMVRQAATWPDRASDARDDESGAAWAAAGEESKRERREGEFVFESLTGPDGERRGMNVLSCAICYQFSRYDAMALVPYMCATDDVVSDRYGSGLRRTGTIAVGAHQCDFRNGDEPQHLADLYPDRIRLQVTAG